MTAPRVRLSNGNGKASHANGHGSNGHGLNGHSDATLTIATLQAEIATSHGKLKELAAERDSLALAAVRNDAVALSRIQEIDAERIALQRRSETLQAAVRQLHDEERAVEWKKFLPKAKAIWGYEFRQAAEAWPHRIQRLMAGRQSHDIVQLANALAELDELERSTAHIAASRALPDHLFRTVRIAGTPSDPAASYKRNAEARKRTEDLLVKELLADTGSLRRPPELEQAIVDARQRLAVEGHVAQPRPRLQPGLSFIGRGQ